MAVGKGTCWLLLRERLWKARGARWGWVKPISLDVPLSCNSLAVSGMGSMCKLGSGLILDLQRESNSLEGSTYSETKRLVASSWGILQKFCQRRNKNSKGVKVGKSEPRFITFLAKPQGNEFKLFRALKIDTHKSNQSKACASFFSQNSVTQSVCSFQDQVQSRFPKH